MLSQHAAKADFQLPEPWRGQIDKATILFCGLIRPSATTGTYWDRRRSSRFGSRSISRSAAVRAPYILDGIRKTKADGSPNEVVRYWSSIQARARELMPDAVPGEHYAITEVVHCKSEQEIGVREAVSTRYALHMESVSLRSLLPRQWLSWVKSPRRRYWANQPILREGRLT